MNDNGPKTILVVDDEELFLRTVADGFAPYGERVSVLTAANGKLAVAILEKRTVDLVVTDLKMPEMDGFELIAHLSRTRPDVPVIVTTAFGTPEIEMRLEGHGVAQCLDKPLDFPALSAKVFEVLAASAGGHVSGIGLPTFLQMIEMDRKTCSVRVSSSGREGQLRFWRGQLVDAEAGELRGDAAALEIVCWDQPEIDVVSARVAKDRKVGMALTQILLEAFRRRDEAGRSRQKAEGARRPPRKSGNSAAGGSTVAEVNPKEAVDMAANEKLKELTGIEGFSGAAVFTPTGESLAMLQGDAAHLKEVGVLANNVLLNAQKASLEMGTGRGQQVHIEAERAHVFCRCLNEGTDPLKSQPGKAHIHLVLVLKTDASIGLAKMRVNSVIEKLAEDFRM